LAGISEDSSTDNSANKPKKDLGGMKNKYLVPNQVLSISSNEIELQQYYEINAAQITELETTNEESLKADQISSAKRSLKTNLAIITIFILFFFFLFYISNRQFFSVLIYSLLKGLLPKFSQRLQTLEQLVPL
jgi:hypothetical protein